MDRSEDPELSALEVVDREWFTSSAVRWDKRVEGQAIMGTKPVSELAPGERSIFVMVLGLRCGPLGPRMDSLIHEMAHLIEIDDQRAHRFGYGLRYKGSDLSLKPTERECRVAGIQATLRTAMGLPELPWLEMVRAFDYLPGFYLVPGKTTERRLQWAATRAAEEAQKWTPETVRREWFRKLALVESRRLTP